MLAIAVVALLADAFFTTRSCVLRAAWWQHLRRGAAVVASPSSMALAVTGVLIALAAPPSGGRGTAALPRPARAHALRIPPLRQHPGHLPPEHPHPLAAHRRRGLHPVGTLRAGRRPLVRVGRELGLSERELLDLEYAALLHDIGQVALVEPIPGGATVLAAPADQRRIEADTVAIVRETGVLDGAARILEHQTTPYRQVRELGEEIPLTSRIIKVVNAYEDLTAGARSARAREAAVERIYLGLGYEYDPRVVDALLTSTRQRASPA